MTVEIELTRVYYVKGTSPKYSRNRFHVKEPPTAGWQHAFVMDLGNSRARLFCPFTLQSWVIPHDAGEIAGLNRLPVEPEKWVVLIGRNWREYFAQGRECDFVTAATVLDRLGAKPPDLGGVVQGSGSRRRSGAQTERKVRSNGKPVVEEALRQIKPTGRRADVARFFLEPASVPACMAKLELTRSGVLSHLYCINRDHGLGYDLLSGDTARLVVPKGHKVFSK